MPCPRCQHANPSHARFCMACGTPLGHPHEPGSSPASYADQERALGEALEQQTATSEILRVISASPADLQPVLDEVAKSAARFCGADDASIFQVAGDHLRAEAHHGPIAGPAGTLVPIVRGTVGGRSVLERRPIHVADVQARAEDFPEGSVIAGRIGHRTILSVPLLREGKAIGAIMLRRADVDPFTDKQITLLETFADQAVIAIENVRLFKELEEKNQALTEAHAQVTVALEQQTATSEILRVISSSPTDLQPVFDAIVRNAVGLCNGVFGMVLRYDGHVATLAAHHNVPPEALKAMQRMFPGPPTSDSVPGRAVLSRSVVHVHDQSDSDEFTPAIARAAGFRTNIAVPMLRDEQPIGAIAVARREVEPFSAAEIQLLRTFADQAVIAIENVRLFTELAARNRDLTATSQILQVISRSPTDAQPVFDAIAQNAVQLCDAANGTVFQFDGRLIHVAANHGRSPEAADVLRQVFPRPPGNTSTSARAILTRAVTHVPDVRDDVEYSSALVETGSRAVLSVPMLRDGTPIGTITVTRLEPGPFTDDKIELLKTFADQAVIAIENVRLFEELEARNRDLTEALDQQTATSEILRVISRSQTDVQPVFDTIVSSAVRLCDGLFSALYKFDDELIHFVAHHNYTPEALEAAHRVFPAPPTRALFTGRTILERAVVHISDVEVDPEHQHPALRRAIGWRSGLFVPMLREGAPIGVIEVARAEPGPFSDSEIELLKTFADQAVIAIENVRLFTELQARTVELTQSCLLYTSPSPRD